MQNRTLNSFKVTCEAVASVSDQTLIVVRCVYWWIIGVYRCPVTHRRPPLGFDKATIARLGRTLYN